MNETETFNKDIGLYIGASAILMITLCVHIVVSLYKHCWCVFAKCSYCNRIGKVQRRKLSCWPCHNCKQINTVAEAKREIRNNELRNEKVAGLNGMIDNDTCNLSYKENDLSAALKDADEKCNSTKAIYKKLLKENIVIQLELLNTKKRLYDIVNQKKNLEKSLLNATAAADRSHFNNASYDNENLNKKIPNVKRRSSFFSSTLTHPIEELNEEKKNEEAVLNNFGTKISGLQEQIRLLKNMHEKEAKIIEEKFNKKNEIIVHLNKLNDEFVEILDITHRCSN